MSGQARRDQRDIPPREDLERLWAPWRGAYVGGDEEPLEGCPFCVLPARGDDAEALIVHRGGDAFVILNAYPYNPGHLMVVPYAHVGDLASLEEAAADELWRLARRAVGTLETALGCDGVNLGVNLGAAAGAGIADHLHLHAVPRWSGDTNFMTSVAGARVLPKALEEIHSRLAAAFADG